MPSALSPVQPRNGITKFTNCRLLRGDALVHEDLWISSASGQVIRSQAAFYDEYILPEKTIDLGGRIISPGFIECQLNGAFGFNFSAVFDDMALYGKKLKDLNRKLVTTGVTSYIPTVTSQTSELNRKVSPDPPADYPIPRQSNLSGTGSHLSRTVGRHKGGRGWRRVVRRPRRGTLSQPEQEWRPQRQCAQGSAQLRRSRGYVRRREHQPGRRSGSHPRPDANLGPRAGEHDAADPGAHIPRHHPRHRPLGSHQRGGVCSCWARHDHDTTSLQRHATAAPSEPRHLWRPGRGRELAPTLLRSHLRRHPPAPDDGQDRVYGPPRRFHPRH